MVTMATKWKLCKELLCYLKFDILANINIAILFGGRICWAFFSKLCRLCVWLLITNAFVFKSLLPSATFLSLNQFVTEYHKNRPCQVQCSGACPDSTCRTLLWSYRVARLSKHMQLSKTTVQKNNWRNYGRHQGWKNHFQSTYQIGTKSELLSRQIW